MSDPTMRAMVMASLAAARQGGATAYSRAALAGAMLASRPIRDALAEIDRARELLLVIAAEEGEIVPADRVSFADLAKCGASS